MRHSFHALGWQRKANKTIGLRGGHHSSAAAERLNFAQRLATLCRKDNLGNDDEAQTFGSRECRSDSGGQRSGGEASFGLIASRTVRVSLDQKHPDGRRYGVGLFAGG
jgi:hypothetical protein